MAEKFNTNAPLVWEDAVSDVGTRQRYPLGMKREEDGKTYRYYKFDNGAGNLTLAATELVYHVPATAGSVTSDVSDSDINLVAGIAMGVVADAGYGWFQTYGRHSGIKTNGDDDISAYDAIIGGGDGTCNSVAQDTAPTNKVVGWATAADVDGSNTVAVFLDLE